MRRTLLFILVLMLLVTPVFANGDSNNTFNDVSEDSWYSDSVRTMNDYGIINGYGDGTFRPNGNVKRSEFAKLLTETLSLDKEYPTQATFTDVSKSSWEFPYVEASKYYFTGYKLGDDLHFKPKLDTQREDIFVSLVKALEYDLVDNEDELLSKYIDNKKISPALRSHVATALDSGLVSGYEENGNWFIKPTKSITRAETAHLLLTIINKEKIVFEEEKIVFDNDTIEQSDLNVSISKFDKGFYLKWDRPDNVQGFKVVASQYKDSNLLYPGDGYVEYTTNTSTELLIGKKAHNADFYKFEEGKTYYININKYYGDGNAESTETFKITMPIIESNEVSLDKFEYTYDLVDGGIVLEWSKVEGAQGYKILASEEPVNTLQYPNDGYFMYTENNREQLYFGQKYHNGNFYQLDHNKVYYFNINAYYPGGKAIPTETFKVITD